MGNQHEQARRSGAHGRAVPVAANAEAWPHAHRGYDFVLLVPVHIDNVNPPLLPRPNVLGIDVDAEYSRMLAQLCAAYNARWHL